MVLDDGRYLFCGAYYTMDEIEKFQKHIQNELDKIYEQFQHQNATHELMVRVQGEIDKLYGEGIFRVTYDMDFDPYSFGVMIIDEPKVRQIMLELSVDE